MARYCPLYFLHVGTYCALFIMHLYPQLQDYAQSCARASAANEISQKQKVEIEPEWSAWRSNAKFFCGRLKTPLIFGMQEEVLCNEGCSKLNEA